MSQSKTENFSEMKTRIQVELMIFDRYYEILEAHLPSIVEKEIDGNKFVAQLLSQLKYNPELDINATRVIPKYWRRSCFLILWAIVEHNIEQIADYMKLDNPNMSVISLKEIKGSFIDRLRKYFNQFGHASHPTFFDLFEKIDLEPLTEFYKIRNLIVHNNAYIREPLDKSMNNIVDNADGLNIIDNEINLEPEYCRFALKFANDFFSVFLDNIDTWIYVHGYKY